MRFAILSSALVAGAYASPILDVLTKFVVETDVVTVTADAPSTPAPVETSVAAIASTNWLDQFIWYPVTTSTTTPTPTPTPTPAPTPAPTSKSKQVKATKVAVESVETPKPSPSKSSAPKASSASSDDSDPDGITAEFKKMVVAHHNIHRKNHSAPAIEWDQGLAETARKIGHTCMYEHNVTADNGGYGQNIAAGAPPSNISSIITDKFYNSEVANFLPFYGQDTPSDMSTATFDGFGHFTQIVWVGSTKVGCAVVDCTGAGQGPNGLGLVADNVQPYFTVCNYSPPGNYLGEFASNVNKPDGMASETWAYDE